MTDSIQSKAGLIGYLQGSIKGTVSTLKDAVEAKDECSKEVLIFRLNIALKHLQKTLVESEEIWERVIAKQY
jgi:hypothetical protein